MLAIEKDSFIQMGSQGRLGIIDTRCDYYVAHFSNSHDYEHVLTQEPWLTRDDYLTVRKWVPNFVPNEEPMSSLLHGYVSFSQLPNILMRPFFILLVRRLER